MYKLLLKSAEGETIDLYHDEYIRLVSIDGIGFKAAISTSQLYDTDGTRFEGNHLEQRGISLIVRYKGARWRHEIHKNRLMRLIGNKGILQIRYITDNIDRYIEGRVESVTTPPNTFPMNTQISVICPDPYWRNSGDNTVIIAGTECLFEFPLVIPKNTGIEFGRVHSETIVSVVNNGFVESGAVFVFTAVTACTDPCIENINTGEHMRVNVSMVTGDRLEICTEKGKKSIRFTHGGVTENYFNYRTADSVFFPIYPGENLLRYSFGSGDEHVADITCTFDVKYGGI